jgi:DNA polymerase-3 subunit alpha
MQDFCHLHCHTQFSLLDGASEIGAMMDKAKADNQSAVAITDHGNMFGVFKFVREANKRDIKPIIGCEFYLVADRWKKSFQKSKGEKDKRYHQLLIAKNKKGYQNLSKLCSLGFTEGLYSKFPRIDKSLIEKYHEGIIATSCCIGAEIPQLILAGKEEEAEKALKWWIGVLGEDFYIEFQRHRGLETIDDTGMSQEDVNQVLLKYAKKYNVKTIVTNDSHYVEEEDYSPHDILLCVNTGSYLKDENRFKFPSSDFYFKSKAEMNDLFSDMPLAVETTMEIADKVEHIELERDILLPAFPLPEGFSKQEDYLRHITFKGAKKRYGSIDHIVEERLNFELEVINHSGYPGYFLIVQDLTSAARKMGVTVGPGRGSAAGSAVAYCLGITNIDPIKYDLLFERFLNPERISMPDIDIDFDDVGRGKVIDYVVEKYGRNQVAQIITYGTMAAKSSIKDVGRVMNIPLHEVEKVTKSFPLQLGASLNDVLADEGIDSKLKAKLNSDDLERADKFRKLAQADDDIGKMIKLAKRLEGSVRNTGIHACGVIITPEDITNIIPVSVAKDSDLLVSQFDNSVAEGAGLLKMDFLGLKTLSIIKDAVEFVKEYKEIDLDIDNVGLEDKKTYEEFEKGNTIGIFQYESPGMQKHLKNLKPNKFEDLIAMNALYRPGPMQYINDFVNRKHGREPISYDLPEMEEYLEETYGITVYQEQVMLLSQKLGGFSKGQADMLRKAMGKKKKKLIDEMYPKFLEGCKKNGHPEDIVSKIWKKWEAFASYAFNKSHSTCYAFIAFQTMYLKAHYPVEFLASLLNHNKNNIASLNFFLREGKRMGITILGPDVNESKKGFSINAKGEIRFGLTALKGVGDGPVEEIMNEREANGPFVDLMDMMRRLNLSSVNKKCLEAMVKGGAMDSFENMHRAQYFTPAQNYDTFLELALKYGANVAKQKEDNQASLFGEATSSLINVPEPPEAEKWSNIHKLELEKEVTGIYLSGHPLDDFYMEYKHYINCPLGNADSIMDTRLKLGGIVTAAVHGVNKRGISYARVTLQDFNGQFEFFVRNEDYENYKALLTKGQVLYVEGINSKNKHSDWINFKIADIKMLDTISKLRTKSITINLDVNRLSDEMIESLLNLFIDEVGEHMLKFKVHDPNNQYLFLDLMSKAKKVDVNFELVNKLEEMGFTYSLN